MNRETSLEPHPAVLESFQTDLKFNPISLSSNAANHPASLAEKCLEAASAVTRKVGVAGVDKICATGHEKQLMIFGLKVKEDGRSEPRVFGMVTKTDVTLDTIVKHIKDQI